MIDHPPRRARRDFDRARRQAAVTLVRIRSDYKVRMDRGTATTRKSCEVGGIPPASTGRMPRAARPARRRCRHAVAAIATTLALAAPAGAQTSTVRIAVSAALSGPGVFVGQAQMDAVRLAVEDANAGGASPRIELVVHDDRGTDDGARDIARQIVGEDALAVIGPSLTTSSLAAGPIYADGGIVSVVPTAHGDAITQSATSFRTVFSTGEIGEALASYLHFVLHGGKAVVVFRDNGYGRPFADGFRRLAERLGIESQFLPFTTPAQRDDVARQAAAVPGAPAILLGMTFEDVVPALVTLRRNHAAGLVLGTATMARAGFADLFKDEPESRDDPAFFTDGVYATSPLIFDSANADALAFAEHYRARYGRDPSWESAQGYDAVRLLVAAVRATWAKTADVGLRERRQAIQGFLNRLDAPATAIAGLTGPVWFAQGRSRQQAVRTGRFRGTLFESAPIQLVPVSVPDRGELAAGAVIDLGAGRLLRRQRVVSTGMFLNELPRVDIAQSTFSADLYLWLRYARSADAGLADPTDIEFPDMVRGAVDWEHPALERDLEDGTIYRLWRVRGDFKNDFDLHHYPLDRQTLIVRLFNSRSAADRIVYALDRRTVRALASDIAPASARAAADGDDARFGDSTAPTAFRNLTQWTPLHWAQRRDVLVTESDLGDPGRVGAERVRELPGFRMEFELRRLTAATLAKTLLPLCIMTLIMFASLYFPHALVKEKVTVAVTGALSGTVLLAAVNSQLGGVGYTLAIEYVFYVFFCLCLLSIVSILAAERLRIAHRAATAATTEALTRIMFLLTAAATIGALWLASTRW
jgi:ABC-type branched-subunit amino acid transport system substrate-binding protein